MTAGAACSHPSQLYVLDSFPGSESTKKVKKILSHDIKIKLKLLMNRTLITI